MPLSVNFSTAQVDGAPSQIVFTDTSTGTDGAVVARRIYLRTSKGEFLVEEGVSTEYNLWDGFPGTTQITLDVLDKDYSLTATVQWVDISGNVLYDKVLVRSFTLYNEEFDYGLTQLMTANPLLINDNDFFPMKSLFRTYIDSGDQATEQAADTYNAQLCYDAATQLRLNSQYNFNGNS